MVQQKRFPATGKPRLRILWREGLETQLCQNTVKAPPTQAYLFILPVLHLRKMGSTKISSIQSGWNKKGNNKETTAHWYRPQVLGSLEKHGVLIDINRICISYQHQKVSLKFLLESILIPYTNYYCSQHSGPMASGKVLARNPSTGMEDLRDE